MRFPTHYIGFTQNPGREPPQDTAKKLVARESDLRHLFYAIFRFDSNQGEIFYHLAGKSRSEINDLSKTFKERFHRDLPELVLSHVSGEQQKYLAYVLKNGFSPENSQSFHIAI